MDTSVCVPLSSQTGLGTSGTPTHVHHCTLTETVVACGSSSTAQRYSNLCVFGSHTYLVMEKKVVMLLMVLLLLLLMMMMMTWCWWCCCWLCLMGRNQILEENSLFGSVSSDLARLQIDWLIGSFQSMELFVKIWVNGVVKNWKKMKLLIRFSGGGVRSNCASFKREREKKKLDLRVWRKMDGLVWLMG